MLEGALEFISWGNFGQKFETGEKLKGNVLQTKQEMVKTFTMDLSPFAGIRNL